jgi:hypothetical protein
MSGRHLPAVPGAQPPQDIQQGHRISPAGTSGEYSGPRRQYAVFPAKLFDYFQHFLSVIKYKSTLFQSAFFN